MFNTVEQEIREKEDIEQLLKARLKKSEICKALGIKAEVLNEKIKKYKLKV